MKWQQLMVGIYKRMTSEIEEILNGLSVTDLHTRPALGANPIGWLIWHETRTMDRTLGDCFLGEQLWISKRWHAKFDMPPDAGNTGYGNSIAQVTAFTPPDTKTLRDYHHAVMEIMLQKLETLTEADLDKEFPFSVKPGEKRTLAERLISNINDFQHIGQAGYVRGIVRGQGWYGR
jgi:hypothetical protein